MVTHTTCKNCNYTHSQVNSRVCSRCGKPMWDMTRIERRVDWAIRDLKYTQPQLYYTRQQLLHLIAKKVSNKTFSGCLLIFALIAATVFIGAEPIGEMPSNIVFVGCLGLAIYSFTNYINLEESQFDQLIDYWHPNNTPLDQLIEKPTLDSNFQDYGLGSYAVNSVIVTEQRLHTDIIVKNGLHRKYNTLVISQDLYPSQVLPVLQQVLNTNPQMPIYFLHNSGVDGKQMITQFKNNPQLNLGNHPMKDIGFNTPDITGTTSLQYGQDKPDLGLIKIEEIALSMIEYEIESLNWSSSSSQNSPSVNININQTNITNQFNPSNPIDEHQKLKDIEEGLWKVHSSLSTLNRTYQEVGQLVKQKENEYQQQQYVQDIDQLIERINSLKKDYRLHRKLVTSLKAQLQDLDQKLLLDKQSELNYLDEQITQLQDQYFARLDSINNSNAIEVLEKMKEAANTAVSWKTYQKQVKQLIEVQDKIATLEMQFLPYKEKIDEQAAELWQAFDQALAPLKDEKAKKAKTRDLIIDYAQEIKDLVKDKETCDQIEAHYQTSINELTQLTQQIEAWQNNHATDQMMDMKNKELWLNYANYEEETFWKTYRELLYNVKNPMIGIASPVQPPQQKQQWEQLYDMLGL